MKKLLQIVADGNAQEVAELAIVLPILFSLIIGIYSFGRAYNIYSTITRAAQAGARLAVAPACVTCSGYTCGGIGSAFPCDGDVSTAVKTVVVASHLDVTKIAQPSTKPNPPACPDPNLSKSCAAASDGSNVYICRNVVLNTTSNTALQACGTIVSFQYPYEFLPVPFLSRISVNIPATAQTRLEY